MADNQRQQTRPSSATPSQGQSSQISHEILRGQDFGSAMLVKNFIDIFNSPEFKIQFPDAPGEKANLILKCIYGLHGEHADQILSVITSRVSKHVTGNKPPIRSSLTKGNSVLREYATEQTKQQYKTALACSLYMQADSRVEFVFNLILI